MRKPKIKNLPVPAVVRAPLSHRWVWWIGPPLVLTLAYRLISPRIRRKWNPAQTASSHLAVASILAGGGWRSFIYFGERHVGVKDGIPFWLDG